MSETISDSNNDNNDKVEQITKIPAIPIKKLKDPKRVAAGKKLADYNRKAKQKQKEVKESGSVVADENNDETNYSFTGISITTMIALAGLGFAAFDLFLRYKSQTAVSKKTEPASKAVETFTPSISKTEPALRYGME